MKRFFFARSLFAIFTLFAMLCITTPGTSLAEMTMRPNQIWYRMHFGMGVGSAALNPQMIQQFIETEVAPRFPMGFNVEARVQGQWMSAKGLIRENNFIINVVVDNNEENTSKIAEVGEGYTKRFSKAKASVFVVKINVNDTMHFIN